MVVEERGDIFRPGKKAVCVNEDGIGVDLVCDFSDTLFQGQQFIELPSGHDGGINVDLNSPKGGVNMTFDLGGGFGAEPEPQFGSVNVSVGHRCFMLEAEELPH